MELGLGDLERVVALVKHPTERARVDQGGQRGPLGLDNRLHQVKARRDELVGQREGQFGVRPKMDKPLR